MIKKERVIEVVIIIKIITGLFGRGAPFIQVGAEHLNIIEKILAGFFHIAFFQINFGKYPKAKENFINKIIRFFAVSKRGPGDDACIYQFDRLRFVFHRQQIKNGRVVLDIYCVYNTLARE
ncbi:MAG: hypothetical protein BWY32_03545 [bacterium ADurb.Bin243]|nr:MAG: hypothetical protein BWY32_03545 [bacterium ADurb.Bin243]